ncbi:hypothetical protein M5689_013877 [Euphorbia peplus]|nr:hypothetical protein M5689_013877 [Euphorbia peplus]
MLDFFWSPLLQIAFESATLCSLTGLLVLSLISLTYILHLHLKSRNEQHLQRFNSLWTVRFLLVSFTTLWAFSELLHLSIFHRNRLLPFLPSFTVSQQINLCKIHVVFSLGLFEPGFLITQLFLVNVSIQKETPQGYWAIIFVFSTCFPLLVLQVLVVFATKIHLPKVFLHSFIVMKNDVGEDMVMCAYPLMSSVLFTAFAIWFIIAFTLSFYKIITIVINKGIRARIYTLAIVIQLTLPLQVVFLGLSALWLPQDTRYSAFVFFELICSLVVAATGEGILVIKPIVDSLSVGDDVSPTVRDESREDQERELLQETERREFAIVVGS